MTELCNLRLFELEAFSNHISLEVCYAIQAEVVDARQWFNNDGWVIRWFV